MAATTGEDTIVALAEAYPGWHIWRGRSGNRPAGWYATRRRRVTRDQNRAGLYPTLAADSSDNLRAQLEQQRTAEERLP